MWVRVSMSECGCGCVGVGVGVGVGVYVWVYMFGCICVCVHGVTLEMLQYPVCVINLRLRARVCLTWQARDHLENSTKEPLAIAKSYSTK